MNQEFYEAVEANPVIAAVKNDAGLQAAVEMEEIQVIFVLYGDVCTIPEILERIKAAGKKAMVHIDLIAGLSAKEISVEFIARQTRADGIITTKPALVRRAKELGIFAVLRFFVIDSLALKNIENLEMQCGTSRPDFIEVLPGVMPKVLGRIAKVSRIPMIAGGLITEKEDVIAALSAGAIAVSSTNQDVRHWMREQPATGAFCSMKKGKSAVWHRKSLRSIFQNRAGWSMIRGKSGLHSFL